MFGIWRREAVEELDTVEVIKRGLYLTLSEAIQTLLVRCPRFPSRAQWYSFFLFCQPAGARDGNNIPGRAMKLITEFQRVQLLYGPCHDQTSLLFNLARTDMPIGTSKKLKDSCKFP